MHPEYKRYLQRYTARELLHLASQAPVIVRETYNQILEEAGLNTDGLQFTLGGSFARQREEEEIINDPHPPDIDVKVQGAPDESFGSQRIMSMQANRLAVQGEADAILENKGGKGPIPAVHILIGTEDYNADRKDWG